MTSQPMGDRLLDWFSRRKNRWSDRPVRRHKSVRAGEEDAVVRREEYSRLAKIVGHTQPVRAGRRRRGRFRRRL